MMNEADMIIDLWGRLKHTVPKKDRLDAADILVAVFDEYSLADGLEEEQGLDKELGAAVKSHYGLGLEEEDDEYEY